MLFLFKLKICTELNGREILIIDQFLSCVIIYTGHPLLLSESRRKSLEFNSHFTERNNGWVSSGDDNTIAAGRSSIAASLQASST